MTSAGKIDVHHHFVPPGFTDAIARAGIKEWIVPDWSVQQSEHIFGDIGVSVAMLSLTSPGVDTVPDLEGQVAIAREANDVGAAVRDAQPSKFGLFATIPNPIKYPDAALSELSRIYDQNQADGVTLMTQYSGKYLGHQDFNVLWTELNRRKAVVFIHPTSPPEPYNPISTALRPPIIDFTFETTRTACDMVFSGMTVRYPDVKIILSHAGGTLPWIWHRPASMLGMTGVTDMNLDEFRDRASSFYFDTAVTGYPDNIELLLKFAKKGHVLFGSDFPYAPTDTIKMITSGLDGVLDKKDEEVRNSIKYRAGLELFPRLKQYYPKA